jgi:hypothetical protein
MENLLPRGILVGLTEFHLFDLINDANLADPAKPKSASFGHQQHLVSRENPIILRLSLPKPGLRRTGPGFGKEHRPSPVHPESLS